MKERGDCLKYAVCESTLSTAARSPFPNGEGCDTRMPLSLHHQSEYTHMWKKNNDEQSLPRVGKVASGASRIGFWRYEREGRLSQVRHYTRAPERRSRGPPSQMEKATKRGYRFSRIVKANTCVCGKRITTGKAFPNGEGYETRIPLFSHRQSEYTHMWKKNNDEQSLPRVGKVASEASRIGFWRDEKERGRSSQVRR